MLFLLHSIKSTLDVNREQNHLKNLQSLFFLKASFLELVIIKMLLCSINLILL